MNNLTFNVGPSKINNETKLDIKRAVDENLLEISHRSPEFAKISKHAVESLRKLFKIPEDWHILFTTSATEAMELALRSTVEKTSFHFTCGNFSEYFERIATTLQKNALSQKAVWGEANDFSTKIPNEAELITITHCETSTGCMASLDDIKKIRKKYPEKILAIDATSIMGAVEIDILQADIWLYSVQKCFGLPSGLGVFICNPRVLERAISLDHQKINPFGAFGLEKMVTKMKKNYNTIATPNILNIYLLGQQAQRFLDAGGLSYLDNQTRIKAKKIYDFIDSKKKLQSFLPNQKDRSLSIICGKAKPEIIQKIHKACEESGIKMGAGYGKMKTETFRIANFPSITMSDIERLLAVLEEVVI
jgi:phosphoserine aminotransferase